ncbi:hypothetical protein ACLEPN_35980 [Myxococcus sp. 1LA]
MTVRPSDTTFVAPLFSVSGSGANSWFARKPEKPSTSRRFISNCSSGTGRKPTCG